MNSRSCGEHLTNGRYDTSTLFTVTMNACGVCLRVICLALGLGNSMIVIHCCDSRSAIVMMIVLLTIVIVVDIIFEQIFVCNQ